MTILQSPIQFADYIMPIGTVLKSQQLDTTIEDTPMLGLHGAFAPSGYALGAIITLNIAMGGGGDVSPTTSAYMLTPDDVNNEANQLFKRLQEGYQQLILGATPARYIMAQKRKFQVQPLEGSGRTHYEVTLEFYAQDPRWLLTTNNIQHFNANQEMTITNAGTARSYPIFTLTNCTTTPKVGIGQGTGASPGISITLNYTPISSDTIIINCDPRNRANAILLNGTPRLDLLGTNGIQNTLGTSDMFPFLNPGANDVWFGFGGDTQGQLAWADAWGL